MRTHDVGVLLAGVFLCSSALSRPCIPGDTWPEITGLDGRSLRFCYNDDNCWAVHLGTGKFVPAPEVFQVRSEPRLPHAGGAQAVVDGDIVRVRFVDGGERRLVPQGVGSIVGVTVDPLGRWVVVAWKRDPEENQGHVLETFDVPTGRMLAHREEAHDCLDQIQWAGDLLYWGHWVCAGPGGNAAFLDPMTLRDVLPVEWTTYKSRLLHWKGDLWLLNVEYGQKVQVFDVRRGGVVRTFSLKGIPDDVGTYSWKRTDDGLIAMVLTAPKGGEVALLDPRRGGIIRRLVPPRCGTRKSRDLSACLQWRTASRPD